MYVAGNHEWTRFKITPAEHNSAKVEFQEFMNGSWVSYSSPDYWAPEDVPEEYELTPEETAEYNKMMGIA